MNSVIKFPGIVSTHRKEYVFKNRHTKVTDAYGDSTFFPNISLYEIETNIPVWRTGLERYIFVTADMYDKEVATRDRRASEVCCFLNYLLYETKVNYINECDLNIIRDFLIWSKKKENGEEYKTDTWLKKKDSVFIFLKNFYDTNKQVLTFNYASADLRTISFIRDESHHRRVKMVSNASLAVRAPKNDNHKKNRVLQYGYLDVLINEARKYEPDLVLAIMFQAYAGLREGEIVNLSYRSIDIKNDGFGNLEYIKINLKSDFKELKRMNVRTNPGSIKKRRDQRVYDAFTEKVKDEFINHRNRAESSGIDTSPDAPIFRNAWGKPLTKPTYTARIKKLFYEHFLPTLKRSCEILGNFAENIAYIEIYENEYPGAHMLRHWFTMYLLTKANLSPELVAKWRGDSNPQSMYDYVHVNEDIIEGYKISNYLFQEDILSRINEEV